MGFQSPEKKSADEIKEKRTGEKKTHPIYDFKSFKGIQLKILQVVLY